MITVQNDWVEYETVPVRPLAVRGGAACAQRSRAVSGRPRPAVPVRAASEVQPAAVPRGRTPEPGRGRGLGAGAPQGAARGAAVAPVVRPRLRLTRRGRLVLVMLPAVLGATAALVPLTAPLAEAQPTRPAPTIVVGTGDTLWSIARRVAPAADPRDVVLDLERANHLASAVVRAGQRLVLPAGVIG